MTSLLKSLSGLLSLFPKGLLEFACVLGLFVLVFVLLWFVFIGSIEGLTREITIFTQCYELSQLHKEGLQ